jgi:hypothetical protein
MNFAPQTTLNRVETLKITVAFVPNAPPGPLTRGEGQWLPEVCGLDATFVSLNVNHIF